MSDEWDVSFDLEGVKPLESKNDKPYSDEARDMIQKGVEFLGHMTRVLSVVNDDNRSLTERDAMLVFFTNMIPVMMADFNLLALARMTKHADYVEMKRQVDAIARKAGFTGEAAGWFTKKPDSPANETKPTKGSAADFFRKKLDEFDKGGDKK